MIIENLPFIISDWDKENIQRINGESGFSDIKTLPLKQMTVENMNYRRE